MRMKQNNYNCWLAIDPNKAKQVIDAFAHSNLLCLNDNSMSGYKEEENKVSMQKKAVKKKHRCFFCIYI